MILRRDGVWMTSIVHIGSALSHVNASQSHSRRLELTAVAFGVVVAAPRRQGLQQ